MSSHYQRWVTETVAWCAHCGRETLHAVSGGHQAHCLEHGPKLNARGETKAQQERREKAERDRQNPTLF